MLTNLNAFKKCTYKSMLIYLCGITKKFTPSHSALYSHTITKQNLSKVTSSKFTNYLKTKHIHINETKKRNKDKNLKVFLIQTKADQQHPMTHPKVLVSFRQIPHMLSSN